MYMYITLYIYIYIYIYICYIIYNSQFYVDQNMKYEKEREKVR